jgi:hypothetical protein
MRAQPFLNFLAQNYNSTRAANLANNQNIRGGWEAWLQVEIGLIFVNQGGQQICDREVAYPSGQIANPWIGYNPLNQQATPTPNQNQAARCDFYLHRPGGNNQQQDDTYVELKCINPNALNPLQDAWTRFDNDIRKIRAIAQINLLVNGIALLATYGQFNAPLPQFAAGINAYVLDPNNNNVSTIATVIQGGANRFFMVAVS